MTLQLQPCLLHLRFPLFHVLPLSHSRPPLSLSLTYYLSLSLAHKYKSGPSPLNSPRNLEHELHPSYSSARAGRSLAAAHHQHPEAVLLLERAAAPPNREPLSTTPSSYLQLSHDLPIFDAPSSFTWPYKPHILLRLPPSLPSHLPMTRLHDPSPLASSADHSREPRMAVFSFLRCRRGGARHLQRSPQPLSNHWHRPRAPPSTDVVLEKEEEDSN